MEQSILARHIAFDFYNCNPKNDDDFLMLRDALADLLREAGFQVITSVCQPVDTGHSAAMILLKEGHCSLHYYKELKYAAGDFYLCASAAKPDKFVTAIRKILRPDKLKTTFLKRGDFGANPDMKPKVKTSYSPLRKIRAKGQQMIKETGEKVIKHLGENRTGTGSRCD